MVSWNKNWKAIGLPNHFLSLPPSMIDKKFEELLDATKNHSDPTSDEEVLVRHLGGGVLETSASECIFVCMLAARAYAIQRLKGLEDPQITEEHVWLSRLRGYCSEEAHSCVEKAGMMSFIKMNILKPDEKNSLRGETLRIAMEADVRQGLIPFFVSCTLGTTSCCSYDNIAEIGLVCKQYPAVWMHVDAAYAGNSFICPEFRDVMQGLKYADSFNLNPNKWLLTNFDCSCLWVKNRLLLTQALVVDPLYLQHGHAGAIDYRHWGIPLSRRFRALKLWFMLRNYGISGLQKYIRHHCKLAKFFESLVRSDPDNYEICNEVRAGLVCFRFKNDPKNTLTKFLLEQINDSGLLHMVPAMLRNKYVIRFCVCAQNATEGDMEYAWKTIREFGDQILTDAKRLDENLEIGDKIPELRPYRKMGLEQRRSYFVRMVSDPKIYNPKITGPSTSSRQNSHVEDGRQVSPGVDDEEEDVCKRPPTSWISWPLGFLFQKGLHDHSNSNDVPVRFRHLATKVHFKSKREQREQALRKSPSPERLLIEDEDSDKSPEQPRRKYLSANTQ